MNKRELLYLFICAVIAAAIVAVAATVTHPKKTAAAPNYKALYIAGQKQVQTLTTTNGELQATATELNGQKVKLCSDLTAKKLTDPICQ